MTQLEKVLLAYNTVEFKSNLEKDLHRQAICNANMQLLDTERYAISVNSYNNSGIIIFNTETLQSVSGFILSTVVGRELVTTAYKVESFTKEYIVMTDKDLISTKLYVSDLTMGKYLINGFTKKNNNIQTDVC